MAEKPEAQTLLAVLYRFEGSEERRLIRTTLDGASISAGTLLGLLSEDGVDMSTHHARVWDEHFKGYSTVRDAPVAVDALRKMEAGPHVPEARVLEVLLEPFVRPHAGFGSTTPNHALMSVAAALMSAAGGATPPMPHFPATPQSSMNQMGGGVAPPHVGSDMSGSNELLPHSGRNPSMSSGASWATLPDATGPPEWSQRVPMCAVPADAASAVAAAGGGAVCGGPSAPPPLATQGSSQANNIHQLQLHQQQSGHLSLHQQQSGHLQLHQQPSCGRVHPPPLFAQMSDRSGSHHNIYSQRERERELEASSLDLALLHAAPLVWKVCLPLAIHSTCLPWLELRSAPSIDPFTSRPCSLLLQPAPARLTTHALPPLPVNPPLDRVAPLSARRPCCPPRSPIPLTRL